MRSTQEKFIDTLRGQLEAVSLELVHDAHYANTGNLFIQPHGSFDLLLSIGYDFQSSYQSFVVGGRCANRMRLVGHETNISRAGTPYRNVPMEQLMGFIAAAVAAVTDGPNPQARTA